MTLFKPSSPLLTHKGWFWFCPIFLNPDDMEGVGVEARAPWLEPLFTACGWLEDARMYVGSLFDPDYPQVFMFKVTGKITNSEVAA